MRIVEIVSRFKRLTVGLLLLILSAYYVNSSMCYHSHVISGETIFHSHFHSNPHETDTEDGGHSVDMAKLISHLSNIAIEEQSFDIHLGDISRPLEAIALVPPTSQAIHHVERCRSLRAPPRV